MTEYLRLYLPEKLLILFWNGFQQFGFDKFFSLCSMRCHSAVFQLCHWEFRARAHVPWKGIRFSFLAASMTLCPSGSSGWQHVSCRVCPCVFKRCSPSSCYPSFVSGTAAQCSRSLVPSLIAGSCDVGLGSCYIQSILPSSRSQVLLRYVLCPVKPVHWVVCFSHYTIFSSMFLLKKFFF